MKCFDAARTKLFFCLCTCLPLLALFIVTPIAGGQNGPQTAEPPKAPVVLATNQSGAEAGKYVISYVESDRRWKFGVRSEPYNKISQRIVDVFVRKLSDSGFAHVDSLASSCCKLKLELLEVTTHPAMFKKPGMDVAATISVHDADGRQLYSKGYRGESRTAGMNTYGHLIDHAGEDLVENAIRDNDLIKAMSAPASKAQ